MHMNSKSYRKKSIRETEAIQTRLAATTICNNIQLCSQIYTRPSLCINSIDQHACPRVCLCDCLARWLWQRLWLLLFLAASHENESTVGLQVCIDGKWETTQLLLLTAPPHHATT